ncbi:hypothetical protein PR202_gb01447 [Eleusine coracana subsp. coracana]|uniref:Uncharacterized protein n=1 Tax=Eleusine coracana subsp. coracana TaxID=191504 RepID=A0AAV5DVW9_ELECO|nr:hypothetical protein PR202_gb01447 [Eleusine coracana subsp. coracana]
MAGRPGYLTLPIFSVLAAIGYVYYTTVFVAVARWLGLATAAGVANAAAFTALAAACVATYAVAVSRDPGRVPPDFMPDVEDAESAIHEIKRKILIIGSVIHSVPKDEQAGSDSTRTSLVLGPNIFCWLCPVLNSLGNGLRYRTSYDIPVSTPPM